MNSAMSDHDKQHGIQKPDDGKFQPPPPVGRERVLDDDDDLAEAPMVREPENRPLAVWSHWGGYLTWIVVPLIFYLQEKNKHSLVAWHAREAINFQITILLYFGLVFLVPAPLFFLAMVEPWLALVAPTVFFVFLTALGAYELTVVIFAALAASRGQRYRYPWTIPFVPRPSEEPSPYDDRE
jgi:uncharacterized Tic20 family protein